MYRRALPNYVIVPNTIRALNGSREAVFSFERGTGIKPAHVMLGDPLRPGPTAALNRI